MRGRAKRKGKGKASGHALAEITKQRGRKNQENGDRGGTQGNIESGKRHGNGQLKCRGDSSGDRRRIQICGGDCHESRLVTQISTVCRNSAVSPSICAPKRLATACEAAFSRSMQWTRRFSRGSGQRRTCLKSFA